MKVSKEAPPKGAPCECCGVESEVRTFCDGWLLCGACYQAGHQFNPEESAEKPDAGHSMVGWLDPGAEAEDLA